DLPQGPVVSGAESDDEEPDRLRETVQQLRETFNAVWLRCWARAALSIRPSFANLDDVKRWCGLLDETLRAEVEHPLCWGWKLIADLFDFEWEDVRDGEAPGWVPGLRPVAPSGPDDFTVSDDVHYWPVKFLYPSELWAKLGDPVLRRPTELSQQERAL